jgi:hypothetical protein
VKLINFRSFKVMLGTAPAVLPQPLKETVVEARTFCGA